MLKLTFLLCLVATALFSIAEHEADAQLFGMPFGLGYGGMGLGMGGFGGFGLGMPFGMGGFGMPFGGLGMGFLGKKK